MTTVKQLIEHLNTFNQELSVVLLHNAGSDKPGISHIQEINTAKFGDGTGTYTTCIVIVDDTTKVKQPVPALTPEAE